MTAGSIILSSGQGRIALAGALLQPQSAALFTLDSTSALAVAWQWLVLLALAFWIGMLVCEGVVLDGVGRASTLLARAKGQTRPLHWLCLAALFVGNIVALILRAAQVTATPTAASILFTSPYGSLWLARMGLIVLAAALPWWVRYRRRSAAIAGLILAGLILLTLVLSSDASTVSEAALTWLSLAALLTWFGSLSYLAYVLLPLLRGVEPDRHAETLIALLRCLHPLLLGAAGVLLVSNIYLSESFPGPIAQFAASSQGQVQLAQWLLTVVMLALGGYALFALRPRIARQAALLPVVDAELPARRVRQSALERTARDLRRLFMLSSWLGAIVLLGSALLVFAAASNSNTLPGTNSPTPPVAASSPTASSIISQTRRVGNLSITLEVTPARVEFANTVLVTLTDTHSGKPVENAQITATTTMQAMNMGTTHAALSGGQPAYRAVFPADSAFSMLGLWNITLVIRQPGHAPVQVVFAVLLNA